MKSNLKKAFSFFWQLSKGELFQDNSISEERQSQIVDWVNALPEDNRRMIKELMDNSYAKAEEKYLEEMAQNEAGDSY